jgi:hypothetical protein
LIENATSEVIKKVNSYFNEIISIGRTIAIPLLAIIGLAGVGEIWGIYSAVQGKAKETVETYLKENDNEKMKKMIQEIVLKVADSINKDPEKAGEITQKIAEILPSQPGFINNLLGNQQFQAAIQTSIRMTSNTSPGEKYYVVTGSAFNEQEVTTDKEKATRAGLNSIICTSTSSPPAYLMVVAPQNNQGFKLDLETAKETLTKATNAVPLFKQNGAYFIAIKKDLFFKCP